MPPYRHAQRGWLTGDTLTPQTGRVLIIPGDLSFIMAVNGALLELTYEWNWEQFGTVTPEAAADAMRLMYFNWIESTLPMDFPVIDLWAYLATINLGVWTYTASANVPFGYYMQSTTTLPGIDPYEARNQVPLPGGTYTYTGTYVRTTAGGIIDVNLYKTGGSAPLVVIVNNRDTYGAFAFQVVTASFVVPQDGIYDVAVTTTGTKNGSSSGYGFAWVAHNLRRTA